MKLLNSFTFISRTLHTANINIGGYMQSVTLCRWVLQKLIFALGIPPTLRKSKVIWTR
jgi:hypothetical protein